MARSLEELQKQYNFISKDNKHAGMGMRPRGGIKGANSKPKDAKNTLKKMFKYIGKYKIHFVFVFLCLIFNTVTSLAGTYFLSPILNKVASTETSASDFADRIISSFADRFSYLLNGIAGKKAGEIIIYLIAGVIVLGFVYLISVVTSYIQSKIFLNISQNAIAEIRKDLFNKLQDLPVSFHDAHPTGETMSRFTNDVDNIGVMLSSSLVSVVSGLATIIGTISFMLYTNVILTAVMVVFVPLFTFGGMAIAKKSSKYYRGQQASLGAVNGYIEETVSGQKVVKVFNHEEECIEEFNELNRDLRSKQFFAQFYGGIMGPVMGNMSKVSYAITAGVGGILCALTYGGTIPPASAFALTFGGLAVFINYTSHFSRPVNEVSQQMTTVFAALAGAERVFSVMEETPEIDNAVNGGTSEKIEGNIELKNVTFGYTSEKTVLSDISLKVKKGMKIAFVGSTGAGKTTITNLINRFYNIENGEILIDGKNILDIPLKILRENIAMVLQDTHLFSGTVADNIRYGRLDATDDEVITAAKTASAHSFIMRLSNGYNTMIEGDGANLSQGQRQLLNIARAAISKAPILILDEATSSVDTRTELHIEHGMDRLMQNRTTLIIAHRLSTVRNADVIFVLEHGKIIEQGNHEQLILQKGRYYQLYTGSIELD